MREWWQRRTLRFRLAVWYSLGGTLLLAVFSATLFLYVRERMARPLGDQLRADLKEVQRRLEITSDNRIRWDGHVIGAGSRWTTQYPWFELWNENGQLVRRFWPFTENRVSYVPSAPVRGSEILSVFNITPDVRLRSLSSPYQIPGRESYWTIRLMRIHETNADALGALSLIIFIALPVVIALLVVVGYILTRRWLLPLDRMAAEADQITIHDLSRRLPIVNSNDELGRLAMVFNDTLDRLQESFATLDRFVADASHELRTPLTTLRNVGEVGLRRSRTVVEYREIIASMLEEAQRLHSLVEQLLELARAEGGAQPAKRDPVPLHQLAAECVNELTVLAEDKAQQITVDATECTTNTDPVLLRQALQNILDNAIKYSPERSKIVVTVRPSNDSYVIEVIDEGPGIAEEHHDRLTERFFRTDSSRDRERGGFGLGLAITKAYMRALDGTLEHEKGKERGSVFRLRLPKTKIAEGRDQLRSDGGRTSASAART